jgi:hypothetical protein
MGFIPALIGGLSGLAGGLLNKPQKQATQTDTTSHNSSSSAASGSTLPVYDPYQLQMRNFLLNQYYNNTNPAAINQLVSSSINQGVNSINDSAGPQEQALRANLAARGLNFSGTAGTTLAGQQANRIGQITQLQGQAPLLRDQLQQRNLTSFSDYLSRLPVGQQFNQSGTNTSDGTQHVQGNGTITSGGGALGGAIGGLGSSLGLMYGLGAFGGKSASSGVKSAPNSGVPYNPEGNWVS